MADWKEWLAAGIAAVEIVGNTITGGASYTPEEQYSDWSEIQQNERQLDGEFMDYANRYEDQYVEPDDDDDDYYDDDD